MACKAFEIRLRNTCCSCADSEDFGESGCEIRFQNNLLFGCLHFVQLERVGNKGVQVNRLVLLIAGSRKQQQPANQVVQLIDPTDNRIE